MTSDRGPPLEMGGAYGVIEGLRSSPIDGLSLDASWRPIGPRNGLRFFEETREVSERCCGANWRPLHGLYEASPSGTIQRGGGGVSGAKWQPAGDARGGAGILWLGPLLLWGPPHHHPAPPLACGWWASATSSARCMQSGAVLSLLDKSLQEAMCACAPQTGGGACPYDYSPSSSSSSSPSSTPPLHLRQPHAGTLAHRPESRRHGFCSSSSSSVMLNRRGSMLSQSWSLASRRGPSMAARCAAVASSSWSEVEAGLFPIRSKPYLIDKR
eukprot:jgi/Mesen1/4620/ME000237S03656